VEACSFASAGIINGFFRALRVIRGLSRRTCCVVGVALCVFDLRSKVQVHGYHRNGARNPYGILRVHACLRSRFRLTW
jgi:hypothetical protein